MAEPRIVTVTGAAGHIGYALLFRIASGQVFGPDVPVKLNLLEIPQAIKATEGTVMELDDCAFPLLADVDVFDDANKAFEGTNVGFLVGSMPRKAGMDRADLIGVNAGIFGPQGKAINDHAADDVHILVVGNPANTNCVICAASAPDVPKERFTAMMRLDHNRAVSSLAHKTEKTVSDVKKMIVWGNHSDAQYPDITFATVDGKPATDLVDTEWLTGHFRPKVAKRGGAIIEARGASSAASAANAAIDQMSSWLNGTPEGDWVTAGIYTDGQHYDVAEGLYFGMPCTAANGEYKLVEGLELTDDVKAGIKSSMEAQQGEIETVRKLGLL